MKKKRIFGTKLWGTTIPIDHKFDDGVTRKLWVHVYRSDMRSRFEKKWLNWEGEEPSLCPLNNSPMRKFFKKDIGVPGISALEQDDDAIDEVTRFFGTFCNATTMESTARELN